MVEQRPGRHDEAPWVLEGGRRLPGHDDNRRLAALRRGLLRHARVRAIGADACDERGRAGAERAARARPTYRRCGGCARTSRWCSPSSRRPACRPTSRCVRASSPPRTRRCARGSPRPAISRGARASPTRSAAHPATTPAPGGSAGYCYLNTAAAAVWTLRESGVRPVGVLDLDLHYPNGTAAILAPMADAHLHSLHALPVTNVPALTVQPTQRARTRRRVRGQPRCRGVPRGGRRLDRRARASSRALVVSLGYDTVAGDPHGSWSLPADDLCADRPPAGGFGAAGVRDPGGRLRAATRWRRAATRSPPACSREAPVVNGSTPSAAASTARRGDRARCSASASRCAGRSRTTSARTTSR